MMVEFEPEDLQLILIKRRHLLELMRSGNTDKRDLERQLDISRPTIDRAFRNLEEFGIISSTGTNYEMTLFGKYVLEEITSSMETIESLSESKRLLDQLQIDAEIPVEVFEEGEIHISDPKAPTEPFQAIGKPLKESKSFAAFFPILKPEYVRMIHKEIVDHDKSGVIYIHKELADVLAARYNDKFRDLLQDNSCSLWGISDAINHGMVLVDNSVLWIGFYGPAGGLVGAVVTRADSALTWARECFEWYRQNSEQVFLRGGGHPVKLLEINPN